MSDLAVVSDRYQRISEWLIRFNEAVMLLKDVYLGKERYQTTAVEAWMDTIATFLRSVLQLSVAERPPQLEVPESATLAVRNVLSKDPFLRSSVESIYKILTADRFKIKKGLSEEDFDVLDRIASILSENASQAFRRIWRHG
jgi:hypothetical protein